jgi:hypothetical protein
MAAMLENPEFLRHLSDPNTMQQVLKWHAYIMCESMRVCLVFLLCVLFLCFLFFLFSAPPQWSSTQCSRFFIFSSAIPTYCARVWVCFLCVRVRVIFSIEEQIRYTNSAQPHAGAHLATALYARHGRRRPYAIYIYIYIYIYILLIYMYIIYIYYIYIYIIYIYIIYK